MTDTADFSTRVVRPDDLLALTFAFVNMRLDQTGTTPRLVRIAADQPAFLVVTLPPQHIAEGVQDPVANPSGLPGAVPVPTLIARPTQLAFRVPDTTTAIPYTLEALLDWNAFIPSLAHNALPDPSGLTGPGPSPAEPSATQTSIELPYALILSPDATGRWVHAVRPVTRNGVTELWHTRLGVARRAGAADTPVDERRLPAVRAVMGIGRGAAGDNLGSPLDAGLRRAVVRATGDFSDLPRHVPVPVKTTHMTLTALGANTDLQASWAPGDPLSYSSFTDWRQIVALGRDQEVRKAEAGALFPFGHRAAVVELVAREAHPTPGGSPRTTTDYLVRRTTLVLLGSEVDYDRVAASGASTAHDVFALMPLRSVRLTDTAVALNRAPDGVFVPTAGGRPFPFHIVARDWAGASVDFTMPLVFVPDGTAWDAAGPLLDALGPARLSGRRVALAPEHPPGGAPQGTSTLPVDALNFAADELRGSQDAAFFPFVTRAQVHLPAAEQLLGSAGRVAAVTVQLTNPDATPGQVFARLADGELTLGVPAGKAGGLASPSLSVTGLSRTLGPVPSALAQIESGRPFRPEQLFSALGSGNLLGGIPLSSVVAAVADVRQLPTLVQPDPATTVFTWQPKLTTPPPAIPLRLDHGGTSVLAVTATTSAPAAPAAPGAAPQPVTRVDGNLSCFALDFADVVRVGFASLAFSGETGKKTSVEPHGIDILFRRELQFLNELADIIPAGELAEGLRVSAGPQGVVAGYELGLPAAGIGVFSLENIAFSATLSIPFVDQPVSLRLAFSERAHPFLVSVAMIGGGGFFAVEVDAGGVRSIEGAVEMGANISVDLAVVSANVHVMGGFYFGMKPDGNIDFSAYLRIGGAIELLGIAGVSIELYLTMAYEPEMNPPSIGGRATVTVGVHLLMFTKSVTLSTERHFAIPARGSGVRDLDPGFAELMDIEDWRAYCGAFA